MPTSKSQRGVVSIHQAIVRNLLALAICNYSLSYATGRKFSISAGKLSILQPFVPLRFIFHWSPLYSDTYNLHKNFLL